MRLEPQRLRTFPMIEEAVVNHGDPDELVEQVAEAMYRARNTGGYSDAVEWIKDRYRNDARAAIDAVYA
jgi:dTDP-D-glucose 4,6-dehydratase